VATQAKGKVQISGRFSPGTTVELHERGSADVYAGGTGGKVTQAKTDSNGVTTFSAPPGNYFAVATEKVWNHVLEEHQDRVRAVDVSIRAEQAPGPVAEPVMPTGPEPPAEHFLDNAEIVVGARSSVDGNATVDRAMLVNKKTGTVSEFATGVVGQPTPAKQRPRDGAAPAPRIEDQSKGTELASSTLTGEAVPPQPQPPKQEDAPKRMAQASDTEEGVQAPAREVLRQEDVKGRQASDTETGTAFPVDPNQLTRSASGTGRMVQTGTSKPIRGTREAQGRSGAKTTAKKAAEHETKANESRQARAARKASGTADETERSRADTSAQAQPATDARGVEHREVPESVGTPGEPRKSSRKAARKR
jgi:hypothetical protein